jgi:hypothetical protein
VEEEVAEKEAAKQEEAEGAALSKTGRDRRGF